MKDYDIASLGFERRGEGRPVLILPGWGCDRNAAKPMADSVIKAGYEAVTLELPGFGSSPEPPEPWGRDEYAACVTEFVHANGLEGCDVMGHSHGGRTAIAIAAAEPELFGRVILIDAAGLRAKRGLKWYVRTYAYKLGGKLAKVGFIDRLFHLSEKRSNAGSADYRAASPMMKKCLVRLVNQDASELLGSITRPTLLIWGENDDATPLYMAKFMEKHIKDCGLAVIPGAGHFSYADDYAMFCAIVAAMLKG